VVTFGSESVVGRCIASARACEDVGLLVVVDNASPDGSAAAARAAGADVVIENTANVGFAAAVNRGLRETSAPLVLLLNPDAFLEPSALAALLDALDGDRSAVMAGPMLRDDGGVLAGARRFSTVTSRLLWHLPLPYRPRWSTPEYRAVRPSDPPLPVDYLWGAALVCRRAFLDDVGGLDERFFLYSEDEDLGRQASARHARSLLVPGAVVSHIGGASTPDAALAQARVELSTARLLYKWEGPRVARAFLLGIGPVLALRALALGLAGRKEEAGSAWRTRRLLANARGGWWTTWGIARDPDGRERWTLFGAS
jgi:N-acetylglucosaminyl-diphospho-decaprenol L-rhamnosyltransferase